MDERRDARLARVDVEHDELIGRRLDVREKRIEQEGGRRRQVLDHARQHGSCVDIHWELRLQELTRVASSTLKGWLLAASSSAALAVHDRAEENPLTAKRLGDGREDERAIDDHGGRVELAG